MRINPPDLEVALRAALLTLLANGFPYVVSGAGPDELRFTPATIAEPVAKVVATELCRLDPRLAALSFTSTWNPDDLQQRGVLGDADPLARFLPPGELVSPRGLAPFPLRDLMVDAVRGLRTPSWRPTSMAASEWVDVLLGRYRPPYGQPMSGPFTSVLDKQHSADWLVQNWSKPELGDVASLAIDVARQFHGGQLDDRNGRGPDRFHTMTVALFIWASLELVRAMSAAGKGDQEVEVSQRLHLIATSLPVKRGSVWALRGRGALGAQRLGETEFRTLIGQLKQITSKSSGPRWTPGPEPFEILVQMTLRIL